MWAPCPMHEPSPPPGRAADLLEEAAGALSGREVHHVPAPGRARAGMSLLFIQHSSLFLRNLPLHISGWKGWEACPHSQPVQLKFHREDLPEDNRGWNILRKNVLCEGHGQVLLTRKYSPAAGQTACGSPGRVRGGRAPSELPQRPP